MAEFNTITVEHWLVMTLLGILSVCFGLLPYFLLRRMKNFENFTKNKLYQHTISVLSCLGGGVLLATTFAHMLPENRTSLESIQFVMETFDSHLPLAEILTLCGFLLIYFLEEVANAVVAKQHCASHNSCAIESIFDTPKQVPSDSHAVDMNNQPSITTSNILSPASSYMDKNISISELPKTVRDKNFKESSDSIKNTTRAQLGAFFAVLALSFHAIMEGIAIGIQDTTNLWMMFGAIASHKFVISFCMGADLCAVKTKFRMLIGSILLFSILSPLGILIGSLLTSEDSTKSFPLGVVEGIATGTLLYVIFMEILCREKEKGKADQRDLRFAGLLQFAAFATGIILMLCLLILTSHGHSHGHGHSNGPCEDHEDDYDEDHEHPHEHR